MEFVAKMEKKTDKRISLGDALRLKKDGNYTEKVNARKQVQKRLNKNRPSEMSSKRAVGRFRNVMNVTKSKHRDPRFDSLSGKFNPDLFDKSYAFIEDLKEKEMKQLEVKMKKTKSLELKQEMSAQLKEMKQEKREKERKQKLLKVQQEHHRKEKQAVAEGKNPFYLKRSAQKQLELKARFETLNESGGLQKYMSKKRKQNASKDHRWLPTNRK